MPFLQRVAMCRRHGKGPYDRRCDLRSTLKFGPMLPSSERTCWRFERACWRYIVSSTTYALVCVLSYAIFLFFRIVISHSPQGRDGSCPITHGRNKLRPSRVSTVLSHQPLSDATRRGGAGTMRTIPPIIYIPSPTAATSCGPPVCRPHSGSLQIRMASYLPPSSSNSISPCTTATRPIFFSLLTVR